MSERSGVAAPPAWLTALEQRAIWEMGAFFAASPLLRAIGRGDNHPVLVLPGFTASDRSTVPLRWTLRSQGYWVHGWGLGRNLGPTPRIVDGLGARLEAVHTRHDAKVSLIGWSLGGIYARELARQLPHMVRQVITLGSPFQLKPGDRSAAHPLWDRLSHRYSADFVEGALSSEDAREPITVPCTAVYSRGDGVVKWYACLEREGPHRENIEVRGSHAGLGWNPAVLYAISDRLAQPEGMWKPFKAPPLMSYRYPKPVSYRPPAKLRAVELTAR
jgi:hypothetical protein